MYVDGVRIGEASAAGDTPHHIIHRLCEVDMDLAGSMQQPAQQGRHEASHLLISTCCFCQACVIDLNLYNLHCGLSDSKVQMCCHEVLSTC